MKKILLVCNAGMSTSMLVKKMEDAAKASSLDVEVMAVPLLQVDKQMNEHPWEVIMLGPQVRHELARLKGKYGDRIPIEVIEMRDYGMMNGEKVLNAALKVIGE